MLRSESQLPAKCWHHIADVLVVVLKMNPPVSTIDKLSTHVRLTASHTAFEQFHCFLQAVMNCRLALAYLSLLAPHRLLGSPLLDSGASANHHHCSLSANESPSHCALIAIAVPSCHLMLTLPVTSQCRPVIVAVCWLLTLHTLWVIGRWRWRWANLITT